MNQVFIKSNVILFMLLVVTVRCQRSRYPPSGQRPNNVQGVPKTRFLELFIVADHELFSHYFNYSEPRMVDFIYEHALQVNSIINKLNVHIILSGYDIHIKRDPIPRGNHFSDRFDKLRDLQSIYSSRFKYDVFYFITGYYYPSTATNSIVLGKAYVNQTCTKQPLMATMYPDAENTHRYTPEGFAVVAAHELGHLLGMKHDTTDCHCPTRSCVMYPSYYEGHPSWSSCSVDIATRFLSSPSMDTCFHHPTQRESIKSICGNGLIEQGEECDCAYLDDRCRRKCCDMDTCKLRGNSRCSSGECCYDCQFKSRDDVCRQRNSHCDEAENCDGRSEFCPKDQFLPAGSVCHGEGESGICYGAKCQTRNDQCKQIAGPNSRSCDDKYYQANTRGDDRGYCDSTPTEVGHPIYTNCSEENVLCGALKCLWNPDRPRKD
ncbi:Disintegrin and metalloproteinase domain-containing protein 28 [Halotydeus destructor]|nr:Disintegrin and metalloproteinase domain-containing protein 28 [Halotydeus destructor]